MPSTQTGHQSLTSHNSALTSMNDTAKESNDISFIKPSKKACPTRFLFVSKANIAQPTLNAELIEIFSPFGDLDTTVGPICVNQKRHVCYVCFTEAESCQRALLATQTGSGISLPNDTVRLICKYADIERPSIPPPEPECVSFTTEVVVPGLTVVENFVDPDEEQHLLDFCDTRNAEKFFSKDGKKERKKKGSYWENTISRRVQHFGYRFNYETLSLDSPRDMCPLPPFFTDLMESKLHREAKQEEQPNRKEQKPEKEQTQEQKSPEEEHGGEGEEGIMTQMTINEYYPGQGISSHIDTPECFGPVIYILSLGCGLTMTMTDKGSGQETETETEIETDRATKETEIMKEEKEEESSVRKKHVWLPARSLLILRGAARYQWAHGIAPRTMDKVDGQLIRRKRRVSFTIREGKYTPTAEDLAYDEAQRQVSALGVSSEERLKGEKGGSLKLSAGEEAAILHSLQLEQEQAGASGAGAGTGVGGSLVASKVEEEHVFRVYDEIAQHWHHTRGKRKVYWQVVRSFLETLPPGTLVADVGCGDGKYFGVGESLVSLGCDRSPNLLQVSRDPNNAVLCCDAVSVPFVSNKFDAAICIAVLHHLASVERRLAVISEIVRILRPGGKALIQAWALEQEATSKRQFKAQDVLVPWSLQQQFVRGGAGGRGGKGQERANKNKKELNEVNHDGEQKSKSTVVFQRFCHVYKEGELEALINKIPSCRVVESGYDKSNWFIMIEKNE